MSFISKLASVIPDTKAVVPTVIGNWSDAYLAPNMSSLTAFGGGATLYPADTGRTYIEKGYMSNPVVYAILSSSAKKFAQIPFYHYKIKKSEVKTWAEYQHLIKTDISIKALGEARKMRTKSIDQVIVDSPLTKTLSKPNRNQSGAELRESLFLYYYLTGEGNQWISRGFDNNGAQITRGRPVEIQVIPKANLNLLKGGDAWDIAGFEINIGGQKFNTPKDNIIMWVNPRPDAELDGHTLSHLRGFAPLEAGRHIIQAYNEGSERLVNMNKNQGAAGFASAEHMNSLDANQTAFMRQQFDSIINNRGMAGKYTVLGGKWAVHQLGMNVADLKMLEQLESHTESICNILGYPPGLLTKNQTHDNQKAAERRWIFNVVAPAAYALRDEWNGKLIPAFDYDRETNYIDCDILSLEELNDDLATKKNAVKDLWQFSPNAVLEFLGYDKSPDPNMDKIYVPANLKPLDEVAAPLDYDVNDIN